MFESDSAPCGNGLCDGGCRVCQGEPPPDPQAGFKRIARRNGKRSLPPPAVVPWYDGDPSCSYECRGFPQGDYGADTFEDARLWLAIDPPTGEAAYVVEIGAVGGDRIVWPGRRFGAPDPLKIARSLCVA